MPQWPVPSTEIRRVPDRFRDIALHIADSIAKPVAQRQVRQDSNLQPLVPKTSALSN